MSLLTIEDLRRRSVVDPQPNGCWHFQGARSAVDGVPRIYTLDHQRVQKRTMSGPKAVWNIAHGQAPNGLVYRRCGCVDCVNPVHHAVARNQAEIGAQAAASGRRKGTNLEQRRAALALGRKAQGINDTPPHLVQAVLAAPAEVTAVQLSAQLGVAHSVVCRIRTRENFRWVEAA